MTALKYRSDATLWPAGSCGIAWPFLALVWSAWWMIIYHASFSLLSSAYHQDFLHPPTPSPPPASLSATHLLVWVRSSEGLEFLKCAEGDTMTWKVCVISAASVCFSLLVPQLILNHSNLYCRRRRDHDATLLNLLAINERSSASIPLLPYGLCLVAICRTWLVHEAPNTPLYGARTEPGLIKKADKHHCDSLYLCLWF